MTKSFADVLASVTRNQQRDKSSWVESLRAKGVCAAHPDDGWVNREKREVVLQYPDFNDGITLGGVVALGSKDQWRIVRIDSKRKSPFGITYWKFSEI